MGDNWGCSKAAWIRSSKHAFSLLELLLFNLRTFFTFLILIASRCLLKGSTLILLVFYLVFVRVCQHSTSHIYRIVLIFQGVYRSIEMLEKQEFF